MEFYLIKLFDRHETLSVNNIEHRASSKLAANLELETAMVDLDLVSRIGFKR